MSRVRFACYAVVMLCVLSALVGCGNKGDLVRPGKSDTPSQPG